MEKVLQAFSPSCGAEMTSFFMLTWANTLMSTSLAADTLNLSSLSDCSGIATMKENTSLPVSDFQKIVIFHQLLISKCPGSSHFLTQSIPFELHAVKPFFTSGLLLCVFTFFLWSLEIYKCFSAHPFLRSSRGGLWEPPSVWADDTVETDMRDAVPAETE